MRSKTRSRRRGVVVALLPLLLPSAACIPYTMALETGAYRYTRGSDEDGWGAPQAAWPGFAERYQPSSETLEESEVAETAEPALATRPTRQAPDASAPLPMQGAQDGTREIQAMIELSTDQLIRADDQRRSRLDCSRWLQVDDELAARDWHERHGHRRHRHASNDELRLCTGDVDERSMSAAEQKWTELLTWLEASWNAEKAQRFAHYQAEVTASATARGGRQLHTRDDEAAPEPISRDEWERHDEAQLHDLVLRVESTWQTAYAVKLRQRAAQLRSGA